MKRIVAATLCGCLVFQLAAPAVYASVNVTRTGDENPMKEVATSTIYGALAGLVVGGAIALANKDGSNNGDIVRWSVVGGTFLGLGMGIWWVSKRPQPTAALELERGELRARLPSPEFGPDGRPRVTLARVTF